MADRKGKYVSKEEFISIWNAAVNVNEVVVKTGMPKFSCQSKACQLRKAGVTLKKFRGGDKVEPTVAPVVLIDTTVAISAEVPLEVLKVVEPPKVEDDDTPDLSPAPRSEPAVAGDGSDSA